MRHVPSRRGWLQVAAGVAVLLLPVAAQGARPAPDHRALVRAGARPAGDVVDRAKTHRWAKLLHAVPTSRGR